MPEPTPAEELRAAATTLRETACTATPGPWGVETVTGDSIGAYSYPGHQFVATLGSVSGDSAARHDAAWIALANPALAEPWAAWLEAEADAWPTSPAHTSTEAAARRRRAALAVARAINGDPR